MGRSLGGGGGHPSAQKSGRVSPSWEEGSLEDIPSPLQHCPSPRRGTTGLPDTGRDHRMREGVAMATPSLSHPHGATGSLCAGELGKPGSEQREPRGRLPQWLGRGGDAGEAGKAFHRVGLSSASLSPRWQHMTRARTVGTHTLAFRASGPRALRTWRAGAT